MKVFDYELVKDPEFFAEGRLPAHSDHIYYKNEEALKSGRNSFRHSLNGLWKFSYAPNYHGALQGFEAAEYDCRSWADIRVPAHIQMEGYDAPQYANVQYPWDGREQIEPGQIPTVFNPTAQYVKYFTVPESMEGRPLYISFQGVESAFAVWLNGSYVGYSEDSFTPSEFDLTPYVAEGENKLAVLVLKWCSGSWCEDQDFFRFSGIFREVYLYTVPEVHIADLKVRTLLEKNFKEAVLSLDISATGKGRVTVRLYEPVRRKGAQSLENTRNSEMESDPENAGRLDNNVSAERGGSRIVAGELQGSLEGSSHFEIPVKNPKLWSAEAPFLYEMVITVTNTDGELQEIIPQKVGFRQFEIVDSLMLLNGRRIVFKGVNRHEFSSLSGRVVSYEELVKDIRTMKQNNINAIRTCHYPNDSRIYGLCDEYGLYMIDEANLESHGSWDPVARGMANADTVVPGDKPQWREAMLDRVNSMYQRDKNHPAILIWSCGNEAFGGKNIYDMSQLFRQLDSDRVVHYEGVFNDRRYNGTSDVESQMYTSAEEIRKYLEKDRSKPFICCEYTHAMGNSCGGMHKYTDLTDREPLYQGGFIWDYIDQSITKKNRYGEEFQAYGGDFGDRPCDFNFSGNGIVYGGDREPSPKMQEVKYNYQNISVEVETETIRIINKNLFVDTSDFSCTVTLKRQGHLTKSVEWKTDVEPLSTAVLPSPVRLPGEDGEYAITVSFRLKESTLWAPAGFEVAFGQGVFRVTDGKVSRVYKDSEKAQMRLEGKEVQKAAGSPLFYADRPLAVKKPFEIIYGKLNLGVRGAEFEALFSYNFGGLVSYRYGGREMLKTIPKPNFWRAPVDNDCGSDMMNRYGQWKLASMYLTHHGAEGPNPVIKEEDGTVTVTYFYQMPTIPAASCRLAYTVYGDGTVKTVLTYEPVQELKDMPEFGVMFKLDAEYDCLEWYGMGAAETYLDRDKGAKLDIYRNKVADNMAKYLVPQECGNKTGVRYAKVTDRLGRGMLFAGDCMHFSALPYTPHELENAMHPYELPPVHYTVIRAAAAQMGVAGDNSWGARPHEEYLLDTSKTMEFTFWFKGI